MNDSRLEAAIRHDRAIVLSSLVLLTALAWTYLFYDAQRMSGMDMGMVGEM